MIRLATYNIKHGSLEGLSAVADVLASIDADVIALQEVDRGTRRSGGVDQAAALGQRLSMYHAFGPAFSFEGGHYGLALLSRHPLAAPAVHLLPSPPGAEQRICLEARIEALDLLVATAHLGLDPSERMAQARALVSLLGTRPRTVLVGDFNEGHTEPCYALLRSVWLDCLEEGAGVPLPVRTYPSDHPTIGIDQVFRTADLPPAVFAATVPADASDHLPVVANLSGSSTHRK